MSTHKKEGLSVIRKSRPTVVSSGNAGYAESVSSCALLVMTKLVPTKRSWGKSTAVSCPLDCTKKSPPIAINRGVLTEVSCRLKLI